ncbi:hypothetical protein AB0442_08140 [Kitasatospora sp. NPDC085895]|uniref:hypothetical protein n=1 Tax=Kitasatospora sp. NPDC085895 TaxID=3155057 RepID=UPI00344EE74F
MSKQPNAGGPGTVEPLLCGEDEAKTLSPATVSAPRWRAPWVLGRSWLVATTCA